MWPVLVSLAKKTFVFLGFGVGLNWTEKCTHVHWEYYHNDWWIRTMFPLSELRWSTQERKGSTQMQCKCADAM